MWLSSTSCCVQVSVCWRKPPGVWCTQRCHVTTTAPYNECNCLDLTLILKPHSLHFQGFFYWPSCLRCFHLIKHRNSDLKRHIEVMLVQINVSQASSTRIVFSPLWPFVHTETAFLLMKKKLFENALQSGSIWKLCWCCSVDCEAVSLVMWRMLNPQIFMFIPVLCLLCAKNINYC